MLLAEFLMIDSDNWYVAPLEIRPGCLYRVSRVRVVDSFGLFTDIRPSFDNWSSRDWSVFALSGISETKQFDGSYMYLPNTVPILLQTENIEDLRFIRDEISDVVWCVEKYYTDQTGQRINRSDVGSAQASDSLRDSHSQNDSTKANMPIFRLMNPPPKHWIPYIPKRKSSTPTDPQVYLRRGRTDESASRGNPQYRSEIVKESWRLQEQEIPRLGLRLQRKWKYARGSDGKPYFWIGRYKDISAGERTTGIDCDYLLEASPK
jgi:hypothetical protein